MKRLALSAAVATATGLALLTWQRPAVACGGCFHPTGEVASDITDERMLLSVSPTQTTLYDQIRYSGDPGEFAWVLPIHGVVEVGLSADVLFASMDQLTATQILQPASSCPPPPDCGEDGDDSAPTRGSFADGGASGGVNVIKQENVGPYATVQLSATDPAALEQWLADNGYALPDDVKPTIAQYVNEHFDFLAMKLLPNQGVQAMRPVRITSPGAGLSMPLRMAAVGTGVSVGITIWVVSDGRYEPQNYPFFRIDDSELIWDFATSLSNYTTLRAAKAAQLEGKGWELESSLALNQQTISSLILSGGVSNGFGGGGGFVSNAADDYLEVPPADGGTDASTPRTAEEVRTDDLAALFAGMTGPNVRVTRLRSDISHAAMTSDFVLQASADQSELTNVRVVAQSIHETCTVYDSCSSSHPGTVEEAKAAAALRGDDGTGGVGGGGCITSPVQRNRTDLGVELGAGVVGLALSRVVRRRRQLKTPTSR